MSIVSGSTARLKRFGPHGAANGFPQTIGNAVAGVRAAVFYPAKAARGRSIVSTASEDCDRTPAALNRISGARAHVGICYIVHRFIQAILEQEIEPVAAARITPSLIAERRRVSGLSSEAGPSGEEMQGE